MFVCTQCQSVCAQASRACTASKLLVGCKRASTSVQQGGTTNNHSFKWQRPRLTCFRRLRAPRPSGTASRTRTPSAPCVGFSAVRAGEQAAGRYADMGVPVGARISRQGCSGMGMPRCTRGSLIWGEYQALMLLVADHNLEAVTSCRGVAGAAGIRTSGVWGLHGRELQASHPGLATHTPHNPCKSAYDVSRSQANVRTSMQNHMLIYICLSKRTSLRLALKGRPGRM